MIKQILIKMLLIICVPVLHIKEMFVDIWAIIKMDSEL